MRKWFKIWVGNSQVVMALARIKLFSNDSYGQEDGGEESSKNDVSNAAKLMRNKEVPWAAICTFLSGCAMPLEKIPGICPIGIG